jgi:hypothetical protein
MGSTLCATQKDFQMSSIWPSSDQLQRPIWGGKRTLPRPQEPAGQWFNVDWPLLLDCHAIILRANGRLRIQSRSFEFSALLPRAAVLSSWPSWLNGIDEWAWTYAYFCVVCGLADLAVRGRNSRNLVQPIGEHLVASEAAVLF